MTTAKTRSGSREEAAAAVPAAEGDATVAIYISRNGDGGPWELIASDVPNAGCYEWAVSGVASNDCRLEVRVETAGDAVVARSSGNFRILPGGIT